MTAIEFPPFSAAEELSPPVASKRPKVTELHGDRLVDNYFWMREKSNSEVLEYIKAENAYADAMLASTRQLQDKLYREMLSRIKQTDLSVPHRYGACFYYSRTEQGKQYPIYYRKKDSLEAPEELILDLNVLARGKAFIALGAFQVSDDGNLLAYSTDETGFRVYNLHVKDLRTGQLLPEHEEDVGSVVWAADSKTLFYSTKDAARRSYRIHRREIGAASSDLVYEENDHQFDVYAWRTRSKKYLLLYAESLTTTEVRFLPADQPGAEWEMLVPRKHDRELDVDHHGNSFFVRINDRGRNFRVVQIPVNATGEQNWKEIVPASDEVMLESVDCFANHYVLSERKDGLPRICVVNFKTGEAHDIEFPEPVYDSYLSVNFEWNTNVLRYCYQSLVTPASIYDYNMDTRETALLKQTEVLGGYDPALYASERLFATASDGTTIPISIVYRKGFKRDGSAPLLLHGYGAYGTSYDVSFSASRLSLLDRGWIDGIAHIRGGGEMGKRWHDQGRMMNKMNTFRDFIAAAEFLVQSGYTSTERLAIEGASAGGLLMGAVANMRPDLFKAVLNRVPFVDVINTMLDESVPLTSAEFEEWGNPRNENEYRCMKQYCPYTNVSEQSYPAMLVKTAWNDSLVMYWEPTKYVARLRSLKTDQNPLILVMNMGGGHGGSSGRYDKLHETALDYAFLLSQIQP